MVAEDSAEHASAPEPTGDKLSWKLVLSYGSGQFGQSILSMTLLSWILYFYSPPEGKGLALLSPAVIGAVRLFERILGAGVEPLVGFLSDKTHSRFGRRIPWIALGAPIFVASYAAIWFPPSGRPTDDPVVIAYFALCLITFWFSYTAVIAPYSALLPELSRDLGQRLRLSIWMSVFEVIGSVVAAIGGGIFAGLGAVVLLGMAFGNGFEVMGLGVGAVGLIIFFLIVLNVRETGLSETREPVAFSLFEALKESLKNPEFVPYAIAVGGLKMATTSAVIGIPFLATQLMGETEEAAGNMLAIVIVIAALAFPAVQRLSERYGKPKVFRWGALVSVFVYPLMGMIGLVPGVSPRVFGVVVFILSGFSVACVMVLPRALLADVIDVDEERTGFRREAMYNGMGGVVEKAGEAMATGGIGILFDVFGNSSANPLGLRLMGVAAACGVIVALLGFRRYSLSR